MKQVHIASHSQILRSTSAAFPGAARLLSVLAFVMCFHANSFAQPRRITERINGNQRFTIPGHVHPLAQRKFDQGQVDGCEVVKSRVDVAKSGVRLVAAREQIVVQQGEYPGDIPETSWNDSTDNSPAASGGGVSQFFSKPSWQTGVGVPSEASSPSAFHDITSGDNIVTATVCGGFMCTEPTTKSVGYSAGAGYDLVTGLGSLDVFAFIGAWKN